MANGRKTNHILINYIWEYENYEFELFQYYIQLEKEFKRRGFGFKPSVNAKFFNWVLIYYKPFAKHQDDRYLKQCFYNLQEKYDRGQKDFSEEVYTKLLKFMEEKL